AGEENPLPSISTSTLVPTRTALGVIESICTGVTTSTGAAAMRSPVGQPQGQSKGLPSKGTSTGKSSPSTSVSPRAVAVNWASPPAMPSNSAPASPVQLAVPVQSLLAPVTSSTVMLAPNSSSIGMSIWGSMNTWGQLYPQQSLHT